METLRYSIDGDGIALIAIDVPDRPFNVLTPQLERELSEAVAQAAADGNVRGVIITSAKPSGFVAGADIKQLVQAFDRGIGAAEGAAMSREVSRRFREIETCGKPVVAAINGLALGGGLELALACHHRVLAEDRKAVLGLPEVNLGLLPGAGGTQRLPRLIGIEKALELMLSGRHVGPQEALQLGIVHALAPVDRVVQAARAWLLDAAVAQQPWDVKGYRPPGGTGPLASHAPRSFTMGTALAAQRTQRNAPAPLAILSCVYEGTQVPIDVGLRIESKYFGRLLADPVARNLMRTLFINKGRADKIVFRPRDVPPFKVSKLGVLGAGLMGGGIAHVAAEAGIEVVVLDATQAQADNGRAYAARIQEKDVARGKVTREAADAVLARIRTTVDYAELAGCDLVVEAVFEDRAVKADVTRGAAAVLGPDTVFASNTSTLPITGLAQAWPRPENFIGLHFFSPVERMPLLEIIRGRATSDATLARALDFARQLRKTPIVVNDSPGFFTSRVFGAFLDEGLAMVKEGVQPALIENATRQAGMPVGPLAVGDEVSLELQLKVHKQALADGLAERFQRALAIDLVEKMVHELGRGGRRAGGGFYEYPADGRKFLWPELARHFPVAAQQPDVDTLKQRILCIQALDAARCMEEGVIERAADADLGSILGIGFPSWTGGVLSYIDMLGTQAFVDICDRLADRHGDRFRPSNWLRRRAARGERFHPAVTET